MKVRNYMECHKCEWNSRRPSKRKAAACFKCTSSSSGHASHGGRTFVSFESLGESVASQSSRPDDLDDVLPRCCQETAARILGFLSDLSDADRNLFMRVLAGQTFVEAARELGVTKQAVAKRWRDAARRHPEIAAARASGAARRRK